MPLPVPSKTRTRKLVAFLPIISTIPSNKRNTTPTPQPNPSQGPTSYPLLHSHLKLPGLPPASQPHAIEGESTLPALPPQSMTTPHWKTTLSSVIALRKGPFGRQDINHSFRQGTFFNTTAFFVFSSGFLTSDDITKLTIALPPLQQLHQAILDLDDYNFRWIKEPNQDWASQTEIDPRKQTAFLAWLFHYNMDTSLVMRFLGGNYTAAYRNVDNIIKQILPYVDPNLLRHYCGVMTTGCLIVFNAKCLRKNFMTYWTHGNNPSIAKKLAAVMKTMNKEERNIFVIPIPAWIARFTPHIFLTPQHNLIKDGKKDQLIFNTAEQPTINSIRVNLMTSTKQGTELDCTFGMVITDFLTHIWNL